MVAPQDAFVNAGGQLNATSFAFLYNVFATAGQLLQQMTQAQADIAAASSGVTTAQNDIANLQGSVTALQGQVGTLLGDIATINARLAAAGIP